MNTVARWDYQVSVEKMRPLVIRWKTVTDEMLDELSRAREELAARRPGKNDVSNDTWTKYLEDIGLPRKTAHRWLEFWNPVEKKRIEPPSKPKEEVRRPKAPTLSEEEYQRRKEEALGGDGQTAKPDVDELLGRIEKELTRKESEEIFTDFDLDHLIAELKERILKIPEISRRHGVINRIIRSMKELAIECDRLSVGRG
jgi:hypothetical protein